MKGMKIFAIFVAMLFLISIFASAANFAVADGDNESSGEDMVQVQPVASMPFEGNKEEGDSKNKEERKRPRAIIFAKKARELSKEERERWKEIREKFRERWEKEHKAKEHVEEIKMKYEEKRKEYEEIKKRLKKSKTVEFDVLKNYLIRSIEVYQNYISILIRYLENTGLQANESGNLNISLNGSADEYVVHLQENYVKLDDLKALAENATNKSELKDIAIKVLDVWRDTKKVAKEVVGEIVSHRLFWALSKSERIITRMEKLINVFEQKGYDVTPLREALNKFKNKVKVSRDLYEQAAQKFRESKQATSVEERNRLRKEAHELLEQAKDNLKEAYKDLKRLERAIGKILRKEGPMVEKNKKEIENQLEKKRKEYEERMKKRKQHQEEMEDNGSNGFGDNESNETFPPIDSTLPPDNSSNTTTPPQNSSLGPNMTNSSVNASV